MALRTAWSPCVGHGNLAFNRKEGLDTASCAIDGSNNSKRIGPRGRKHNFNEKPLPCTWPVIGCAVSVPALTFLHKCCPNSTKPLPHYSLNIRSLHLEKAKFLLDPSPIIGNPCHSLTNSVAFRRHDWCNPSMWRCQVNFFEIVTVLMLTMRIMLTTVCCRFGSWGLFIKPNIWPLEVT